MLYRDWIKDSMYYKNLHDLDGNCELSMDNDNSDDIESHYCWLFTNNSNLPCRGLSRHNSGWAAESYPAGTIIHPTSRKPRANCSTDKCSFLHTPSTSLRVAAASQPHCAQRQPPKSRFLVQSHNSRLEYVALWWHVYIASSKYAKNIAIWHFSNNSTHTNLETVTNQGSWQNNKDAIGGKSEFRGKK